MFKSKAGAIVSNIWDDSISDEEKLEAIKVVSEESINRFSPTIRKEDMQEVFKWLMVKLDEHQ